MHAVYSYDLHICVFQAFFIFFFQVEFFSLEKKNLKNAWKTHVCEIVEID